jgi:hypothetical protein
MVNLHFVVNVEGYVDVLVQVYDTSIVVDADVNDFVLETAEEKAVDIIEDLCSSIDKAGVLSLHAAEHVEYEGIVTPETKKQWKNEGTQEIKAEEIVATGDVARGGV